MSYAKPVTIKLPPDLAEACEIRAKALHYPSLSAYVRGLLRYDLLVQGPHSVTLPIAHLRPKEQDAIDAKLLRLTQNGVGERGQFRETLLARVRDPERVGKSLAE
jgi:hypothetical protein